MQCPKCGNQCKEGVIRATDPTNLLFKVPADVSWNPAESEGKIFKKGKISLKPKNEGYYCENCRKVYAALDLNEGYWMPEEI